MQLAGLEELCPYMIEKQDMLWSFNIVAEKVEHQQCILHEQLSHTCRAPNCTEVQDRDAVEQQAGISQRSKQHTHVPTLQDTARWGGAYCWGLRVPGHDEDVHSQTW